MALKDMEAERAECRVSPSGYDYRSGEWPAQGTLQKGWGIRPPKSFSSPIWSLPGLSLARLDLKPVGIEAVGPAHLGQPPRTKSRWRTTESGYGKANIQSSTIHTDPALWGIESVRGGNIFARN